MNIVLEGPDATGKSTLARFLSQEMQWPIIPSEGPEKFPGEVNERIRRYGLFDRVIFDRHPCVSQGIYSIFNGSTSPDQSLVFDFYDRDPILIYCTSMVQLDHETKDHDTPAHLKVIKMNEQQIRRLYDQWAIDYAHAIHRVGRSPFKRMIEIIHAMGAY